MEEGAARTGYRSITATLQRQIEAGEIPAGSYLPTERKLQDAYGASRTTIRRALASLVDTGWAENLPGRGVVAARGYRRGTTRQVACVDSDSYVARMLRVRLEERLNPLELDLVPLGRSRDEKMEHALRQTMEAGYAAVLVWAYEGFPDPELVGKLNRQLPIVALDHRLEGADCDLVSFDYEQAAFDATEHLIQQGARRIGIVGMIDMLEINHQRFRGYLHAMFAHGLQPQPRDFIFFATSGHDNPDISILETRLRSGDRPDALFVMQDTFAADTVATALRAGLFLPHDLKLATLGDDIDVSVDEYSMTAVAFDWERLAEDAFTLVNHRLDNLHRPSQTRLAPHHLIVRGLCGAPAEAWTPESQMVRGFRDPQTAPRSETRFTSTWRRSTGGPPVGISGGSPE
jgi:LacI family transcriptional regulator